jgi:hypothetical protein
MNYKTASLNPDELAQIGLAIEQHVKLEKKMIENARQMLDDIEGKKYLLAQQYFIKYLLDDEIKHSKMLESLQILARGMRDSD